MAVNAIQTIEYKVKAPRNKRNQGQKHTAEDTKKERKRQNASIQQKKTALEGALKCPPAIHQFKKQMDSELKDKIEEVFMRYRPSTPEEKAKKLEESKETGVAAKKELTVRLGIVEVVKLIEKKKAKFVLIANNVDPIEVVLFLPSLCKKMGVSYAIFDTKERLGAIVRRKAVTCLALTEVVPGLEPLIKEANEEFADQYVSTMKTWGVPAAK
ncbi:large subunit ribosomal protein L7Ae [Nematocida displodere]|uniref:60S ribosomal protein L8 n=1 Tax=Nematocida displodere TaxID=1805483 RepID=A0A177EJH9_9MICR|nr:large subunit ribosomal protein L7Ae [Nematocida displodere]